MSKSYFPNTLAVVLIAIFIFSSNSHLQAEDVIKVADRLVQMHLRYVYGSEDPKAGGIDCSAFVRNVCREAYGIDLPDEADKQLDFIRKNGGQVWDAKSDWTPQTIQPGDLIFWSGPLDLKRESEISHVMMYVGNGLIVGSQGKGHQIDGTEGGVGYYRYTPGRPLGILDSSGREFIGHRHVFVYARMPKIPLLPPKSTQESLPIVPVTQPTNRAPVEAFGFRPMSH